MIHTSWNLSMLYTDDSDPKIESDLRAIETRCAAFEKKYKNKDILKSIKKVAIMYREYESIVELLANNNPTFYYSLRLASNSNDDIATACMNRLSERITLATNRINFFELSLAKAGKAQQKELLEDKHLRKYKYSLEKIFQTARYNLTEPEESLLSLLSNPARESWIDGQEKVLSDQTIELSGKRIPIAQAVSMVSQQPKAVRRKLHRDINTTLREISRFAESEINAIYSLKKITDERRGFSVPYASTVLHYENELTTVESLVSVITDNFSISHDFYRLHAKILKERKLSFADRNVPIGTTKTEFNFESTVALVKRSFNRLGSQYGDYVDSYIANAQIDVFPKIGKTGGAFCASTGNLPVFVLLNHTNSIRSVETLAHEMGHAIHSEKSKSQTPLYQGYTTSVAEVASTFFERLVNEELFQTLPKKDKKILLHNQISGDIQTIFRQIACFNFELELHNYIRTTGYAPREKIAELMTNHMRSYTGDAFEFDDLDGYFFVYWSHIRNHFYVYTYALGQMVSRALFENWKRDNNYIDKIEKFLSAGCSMSPREIFLHTGIDISDPRFYETALQGIRDDINTLNNM